MPRQLFAKPSYTVGQINTSELEGEQVTTSDSVDLPSGACVGIGVLSAGNVNVNLVGGGTAVLTSLVAGQLLRINVSRILSTSTTVTAGNVYALYPAGNL